MKSHPEHEPEITVEARTRDDLLEVARKVTQGSFDFMTEFQEGDRMTQLTVQRDAGNPEGSFLIGLYEPSTDRTLRLSFMSLSPDGVNIDEAYQVDGNVPMSEEQAEVVEEIIGNQKTIDDLLVSPVPNQQERAERILEILQSNS